MNNIPDKIYYHLGYNNLGLILDQERKHWLMKVDKHLQIQDKTTGELFEGTVNNLGSDVIVESEKLDIQSPIADMTYVDAPLNKMLQFSNSAFTYSYQVNGFMFSRVTSINYQTTSSINPVTHTSFRLVLPDCEECIIPFAGRSTDPAVFAGRWLKTTTTPYIQLMDDHGEYTTDVLLTANGCTNPVYYYPLNENLQPFEITLDSGNYVTEGINTNECIGLPLYWFTCDETNIGPTLTIANNESVNHSELVLLGNPGNADKHNVEMYVGVDGNNDATPDDSSTSEFCIICSPVVLGSFTNSALDFNVPINPASIAMKNTTSDQVYNLGIAFGANESSVIKMNQLTGWTYVDDSTYMIEMSEFDSNCLELATNALIPVFNVTLDTNISFEDTDDSDTGCAGVRMGVNPASDIYDKYPYQLNEWDGLPAWFTDESANTVPEHVVAYAIHNTPDYIETQPDTRQTAALILDPGKRKTGETSGFTNDERGRVYIISNDDTTYRNNLLEKNKEDGLWKPDRTAARICDIPTSVMELTGISGLSPDPVVDKKYVRSYASYSDEDKNRLWNEVNWMDRWVRPTALDAHGIPITANEVQANDKYVFYNREMLELVDMIYNNNFKIMENLNVFVDPEDVSVSSITEPGTGYAPGNTGRLIIGGCSFEYLVDTVNTNGGVTSVSIASNSEEDINLANFDMIEGNSGITVQYGTSPDDPQNSGTGLKLRLLIADYVNKIPKKSEEFLHDLHAFVHEHDGIWLYEYYNHNWRKEILVSPFERSSVAIDDGLSTPDAYMTSIMPIYSKIEVAQLNQSHFIGIEAYSTGTFINIIDKTKTPITPNESSSQDDESTLVKVDLCRFISDGIRSGMQATSKSVAGVLEALKNAGVLMYDSYVLWKWSNPSSNVDFTFSYAIVERSLNNYLSTDSTTKLPVNDLRYDKYVHSNASTTVVWDAPGMNGVMMWVYDPTSTMTEKYVIDPSTQDLYVDRKEISWDDIGLDTVIVDEDGVYQWNILSNRSSGYVPSSDEPIYQQPDFVTLAVIGENIQTKKVLPTGNWKLVFPRVESYTLTNSVTGVTYKPLKMQMISGSNLGNFGNVLDEKGNLVNRKTLVLNELDSGLSLNMFNENTGRWENV